MEPFALPSPVICNAYVMKACRKGTTLCTCSSFDRHSLGVFCSTKLVDMHVLMSFNFKLSLCVLGSNRCES